MQSFAAFFSISIKRKPFNIFLDDYCFLVCDLIKDIKYKNFELLCYVFISN